MQVVSTAKDTHQRWETTICYIDENRFRVIDFINDWIHKGCVSKGVKSNAYNEYHNDYNGNDSKSIDLHKYAQVLLHSDYKQYHKDDATCPWVREPGECRTVVSLIWGVCEQLHNSKQYGK